MREIKFRVRHADTKKVIGYERVNEQGHWESMRENRQTWLLGAITSEDDLIREQFSGLQDKNRKDIYESDNLQSWYSRDVSGTDIVEFDFPVEYEVNEHVGTSGFNIDFLENAKIIGNIYQSPSLTP